LHLESEVRHFKQIHNLSDLFILVELFIILKVRYSFKTNENF